MSKAKQASKAAKSNVVLKNLTINVTDKDFSEALQCTRTLFKDIVTKTAIVESSLACAASTKETFTCTKIASFIEKTLKVKDCFHKREQNKANNTMQSTTLRVRHHVKDTIKTNHIADQFYSYNSANDSITFTDKYIKICKSDIEYRKHVSAFLKRVKSQYFVSKKAAKNSKAAKYTKKQIKAFNKSRIKHDSDVCRMQAHAMNCEFKAA